MDDTLLEKLDEMLTTYGVPHAFSLPHEKTMEECPEATLEVAYDSSDDNGVQNLCVSKAGQIQSNLRTSEHSVWNHPELSGWFFDSE